MDEHDIAQLFYQALEQVMLAEAGPMLELWSERNDISYIDPQGQFLQSRASLVAYWQRAVQLNGASPDHISAIATVLTFYRNGHLLYTIMSEQIQIHRPPGTVRMRAISTNIYRQEGPNWRMLHRHSGLPVEEKQA